ncbi:hypothetical protein ABIG06_006836 [Bradyrhizobium sp. USDA 326]|uniref:hypothetical protein n=1 Tax=unclassified Bradyrhizobium TaxID=2631580 RepID=UPI0035194F31
MTVEPQALVTWPCLDYIMRVSEVNDFASFFFGVIEARGAIAASMTEQSAELFAIEAEKYAPDSISLERQMVQEILLSRIVESFNHYVSAILSEVFLRRPEMLSAEGQIKVAKILELRTFDEIVRHLVDKKLHELSYSSLSDVRAFIKERTKIDLYRSEDQFKLVQLASEVRNLIAHNDCKINDVFLRRTGATTADLPLRESGKYIIRDDWLHSVIDCLGEIVFSFDNAVAGKFDLDRRNRFGIFSIRH